MLAEATSMLGRAGRSPCALLQVPPQIYKQIDRFCFVCYIAGRGLLCSNRYPEPKGRGCDMQWS